jgi:hypothetical protein
VVLLPTIGGGGRRRDLALAAGVSCISLSLDNAMQLVLWFSLAVPISVHGSSA